MAMMCYCMGFAQQYTHTVNFRTTDLEKPIEKVEVENLTRNTKVTVPANAFLMLRSPSGVEDLNSYVVKPLNVYPNPSKGSANFSFQIANSGDVKVVVYSIVGKAICSYQDIFDAGSHQLKLAGLKNDMYLISVKTKNSESIGKLLVFNSNESGDANISLINSSDFKSTDGNMLADQGEEVVMDYTNGDKLLFTAFSGNDRTIISDSPKESKDIVVKFVECLDMDGNNYAVVQVGKYFMMAENLKATKNRAKAPMTRISTAGDWAALPNSVDAKAFCIYDNLTANAATYGNLYTFGAAVDAMPLNFRLPTKSEMTAIGESLGDLLDAGGMLKGLTTWSEPNYGATNQVGFNGLAGGYRKVAGDYAGIGDMGQFMLSDVGKDDNHAYFKLQHNNSELLFGNAEYTNAMSVRGIYELEDISVIQDLFGNSANPKPPVNQGTPLPKKAVFLSNESDLYVISNSSSGGQGGTTHPNDQLIPEVVRWQCVNNNSGTISPIETNLPKISSVENMWWNNIKKTAPLNNEFGKQDILVAVWDAKVKHTRETYKFGTRPITFKIMRRADPDSENLTEIKSVELSERFTMPTMEGTNDYCDWHGPIDYRAEWPDYALDLVTADVTGDGRDEIILTVHDQLYIYSYDGNRFELIKQKSFKEDHNLVDTPGRSLAFYLKVRVADMDRDGMNDICVMTSARKSANAPILHIYFNGDFDNANNHKQISVTSPPQIYDEGFKTATFTIDDIDQDGNYEVVICHMRNHWHAQTWLSYYKFNPKDRSLTQQSEIGWVHSLTYSEMTDIKTARLEGPAGPVYIIYGKNICRFNKDTRKFEKVETIPPHEWMGIWGTQIVAGNFDNDPSGRDIVYFISRITHYDPSEFGWNTSRINLVRLSVDANRNYVATEQKKFNGSPYYYCYFHQGSWETQMFHNCLIAANTKTISPTLEYVGYEYTLTKPVIDAVLCAAPHYPDYMTGSVGTSWGKSTTVGSERESEYTHTASLIFGYEQEISIFGIKIGGISFETKISQGFSQGFSNATTTTKSISYTASNEDVAVVTSIPYDSYFYRILSSGNPKEVGKEMQFSFPRKPITQILSIESYNKIVEDTPDYPKIGIDVLKHEGSDPTTYPTDWQGLSNVLDNSKFETRYGDMSGVGNAGEISKGIEISTEMAQSAGTSFTFETELVGQTGGFKAGVGYSYNNSNKVTNSVGQSMDVGGTVCGIPVSAPATIKRFDWDLIWYNYIKQGQRFHVINYQVVPRGK